jgi:hypothetical protein
LTNCDRCEKLIVLPSPKLFPHKLVYGHLKEPPTEEVCFLCSDCYKVWDKMFLKEFGSNDTVKDDKTAKRVLNLILELLKGKEVVEFT